MNRSYTVPSMAERDVIAKAQMKRLDNVRHEVDNSAPRLAAEMYLKPKTLVKQSQAIQKLIKDNLKLMSQINVINKTEGKINCWKYVKDPKTLEKLRRLRMIKNREMVKDNKALYQLIRSAKTEIPPKVVYLQPKSSKRNVDSSNTIVTVNSSLKNISGLNRYWMDFQTDGGVVLGRMMVELFDRKCPITCQLFRKLIKGTPDGRAYAGTRVYLIVPGMYCALGDVVDNNGFGELIQEEKLSLPENFMLDHYQSGILSMHIQNGYVNGMFNITFRAMPLLDRKAVVFGRVVSGRHLLTTFSSMGTASGMVSGKLFVNRCGWISKSNKIRYGLMNTTLPKSKDDRASKLSM